MSIRSALYYWLICDGCGRSSTLDNEISAWAEVSGAEDDATYDGWDINHDAHYCSNCSVWCDDCGEERVPRGKTCKCGWTNKDLVSEER